MSKFAQKVLEKLKKEKIKILPRWRFAVKRAFVWGSLIVAILLCAFSVSMMIFQLVSVEWDLLPKVMPPPFGFFIVLPYFWLLISILLFVFVYFDFRNTRKGHRYSGGFVVIVSFLIALILGVGIYFLKTPERADEMFFKIPMYEDIHKPREMMWNAPEHGVLAGIVIDIDGNKAMILEDFGKEVWFVNISSAEIHREIFVGNKVKAVGDIIAPLKFTAREVRFFKGH